MTAPWTWRAAIAASLAASIHCAPTAAAPAVAVPLPTPSSSDSVYASTAGGFESLSGWNRFALIATILVFLLLSILSGRELWRYRYGRRSAASAGVHTGANGASAASTTKPHHHTNYTTPKYGGGMPTPSTGPLTSSDSAVGISASAGLIEDESSAALSTGAEMRLRLFALLFAASTIRVVSLVVEITTLRAMVASPAASLHSRLLSMFLWIPALLFVSMYGLVLLFWAQLCYACWGKAYPWPRRVFFLFNVLLYVVFVVLLFATSTSGSFWRACDLMLGGIYALGLVGILYYSARLIQFFRQQGPDEDFFFDLPNGGNVRRSSASPRQIVLRRIAAVCVLLSVLFTVKAAYLISIGIGFVPSEETQYRTPVGVHHLVFEFTMHFFTEFVPCALLLFFTRKQQQHQQQTATSTSGGTTPNVTSSSLYGGLPSGMASAYTGLRGRNNSSHSAYQDDQSVGSGSFTGYQFQAVQRTYGFGSVQRAANVAYQSIEHVPSNNGTTATSSSGIASYT